MVKYGLIGNPVSHSFSAEFFNKKFNSEGIEAVYGLYPLGCVEELRDLLEREPLLKGLNVTIPFKTEVIALLDELDPLAEAIGAVNVIRINPDGTMKGFNTDAIGFRDSIMPLVKPAMRRALVLGTGGASKAVSHVLEAEGIAVDKISRGKPGFADYAALTPQTVSEHQIIVNATPAGMWPETDRFPPIPYEGILGNHLCYDLIYNPETTTFMKLSALRGATVKNGREMLVGQALAAWKIWNS